MQRKTDAYHHMTDVVCDRLHAWGLTGSHIAVALSGGADSTALLHVLCDLREAFALRVSAIHVHHHIRASEADEDMHFAEELCTSLDVPLKIYHVDAPAVAEALHMSLESAARQERYRAYAAYHETYPDAFIAMAHHADDQFETVMFRMARGTGLRGMCGMPARRDYFIRPLLSLRAREIREVLSDADISYREDSTNADIAYTRNFLRHEVTPAMERVHEGAVENISLMTESLREDEIYLSTLAKEKLESSAPDTLRDVIAHAPTPIAKRMIRQLYEVVRGSVDAMTAEQMNTALALIRSDKPHVRMTLPCDTEMYIDRHLLLFRATDETRLLLQHSVSLGVNVFEETGDCLILSDKPIDATDFPIINIYKLLIHSALRFDTMDLHLYVRRKQEGDAYRYGGMTRTLKKLFNDKKLSLASRAVRPVLCDDAGILWVPGFGVRDTAGDTKNRGACCIYALYCSNTECYDQ